jgi:hypothetical protein
LVTRQLSRQPLGAIDEKQEANMAYSRYSIPNNIKIAIRIFSNAQTSFAFKVNEQYSISIIH